MRFGKLTLLAASCAMMACASASKSGSNSNIITAAEISAANVPTAYDAVDRLHRSWFHDLSSGSSGDVAVYMDNQKLEKGKEALRDIPAQDVASLQYLKATDAVMRFGHDASGGAIIVVRK